MTTPQEIKNWLKKNGITRQELAERCFVKRTTVDNWLKNTNPRKIPKAKIELIEKMMEGNFSLYPPVPYDAIIAFPVRMSKEEWELLCRASGARDLESAENFAREMLQKAVEKILFTVEHNDDLMAAEDDEYLE